MERVNKVLYTEDALQVAPELLGKHLCRKFEDGTIKKFVITETEAYCGTKDLACHASKGRTTRTEAMFHEGGVVYVYLIYGMYWLLNIVTGNENDASAVLIRGVEGISGPGRVGRALMLDKTFYSEDLITSKRLWIEESGIRVEYTATPRIGIDYAREPWVSKPWRFMKK